MFVIRRIDGHSMDPTLPHGKVVIAFRRPCKVGDVVIVLHNGRELIKRISQCDGERIYLLGDNLAASTDSRSFGWLPMAAVRGVVFARAWA